MLRNYKLGKVVGLYVGIMLFFSVCVLFPIILSFDQNIRAHGGMPVGVVIGFFLAGVVFIGGFIRRIYLMRPILIDDSGVTAFFCGKPWSSVAWNDVKKIEKSFIIVMFDRPQAVISIYSADKVIRFDDWIWNYEDLLQEVSVHARALNIPTFERKGKVSTPSKIFLF